MSSRYLLDTNIAISSTDLCNLTVLINLSQLATVNRLVCWNVRMQRKLWLLSLVMTGSLALMAGQTDTGKSAGQDLKDAGQNTTDAVKKGAKKTGRGIKKGTHKAASETEKGAGKLKTKTSTTSTQ